MSLKKNILANYTSKLYVTGVGILILPLYIKYMGSEAYGLIGFFTMLQAWFTLLDIGLTPTIARETARYYGGSMTALTYRQLFRSLSVIFIAVAAAGGIAMWYSADFIANKWLNVEELDINEVVFAVQIMAFSVSLRWLGGLYRGVITGAERLVWLSIFNAIIATLRFVAVFFSMSIYGYNTSVFFLHQLLVIILEIIGLLLMSSKIKPVLDKEHTSIGWSFSPIKSILKFALTIAFTSSIWVLVTQTDKLILSGILSLTDYGHFTLAVLVAGGIMIVSGPISSAVMPRMARLHAQGKNNELISVYRNATQLVSLVAGSASITIAFFAEILLFTWTGDKEIAVEAAPILSLYALGNGVLVMAAFPYYLQYALGNLRYHLIGNVVTVFTLIPAIVFAAIYYGGVGAGYAWLSINSLYLILWVGFVHSKLHPGLHTEWLIKDCLFIYLPVIIVLGILKMFISVSDSMLINLTYLTIASCLALITAVLSASNFRERILFKVLRGS